MPNNRFENDSKVIQELKIIAERHGVTIIISKDKYIFYYYAEENASIQRFSIDKEFADVMITILNNCNIFSLVNLTKSQYSDAKVTFSQQLSN